MTNFEFYEDEIKSRGFNFAVDKSNGELFWCDPDCPSCNKCEFCYQTKEPVNGTTKFECSRISIGNNFYGSNPMWYKGGYKNGIKRSVYN